MKKKAIVPILAVVLILALSLCLVGCTVSGTYTSKIGGEIAFSGKNFTYTSKTLLGTEVVVKGTFKTEAFKKDDEKKKDGAMGSIVYYDNDKEISAGIYGKDSDGKAFVSYGIIVFMK